MSISDRCFELLGDIQTERRAFPDAWKHNAPLLDVLECTLERFIAECDTPPNHKSFCNVFFQYSEQGPGGVQILPREDDSTDEQLSRDEGEEWPTQK